MESVSRYAKKRISPVADDGAERRLGGDRRRQRIDRRFLFAGGRRVEGRRFEDRQGLLYLDRYQPAYFRVIILILIFSVMDALLTLVLINHGAVELNPIMAFYLELGPYHFLLVKYALTSAGVIIILLYKGAFMYSLRIQADTLLYVVLAAFVGVVSWQVYLIHKVVA
jgi:hypothetical protein